MDKAEKVFYKIALDLSDIEDHVGTYFDDELEKPIRKMIQKKKDESFVLRHPYLTGIPTLGLAPSAANWAAKDEISRRLARAYPDLRKHMIEERRERARNRAVASSGTDVYIESNEKQANEKISTYLVPVKDRSKAEYKVGNKFYKALSTTRDKDGKVLNLPEGAKAVNNAAKPAEKQADLKTQILRKIVGSGQKANVKKVKEVAEKGKNVLTGKNVSKAEKDLDFAKRNRDFYKNRQIQRAKKKDFAGARMSGEASKRHEKAVSKLKNKLTTEKVKTYGSRGAVGIGGGALVFGD